MPQSNPRWKFTRITIAFVILAACAGWLLSRDSPDPVLAQTINFKNFEGPQIHPLAMTPDGTRLLAVNTPNASLSIFYVAGNTLSLMAEIPVGLEPVSVAARNNNEAWVVNWLSDSVSVIDLNRFKVSRSFEVGDEPTDVLFAGQQKELAFVCVSGLSTVKVFDPATPAASPQVITISGKQPRALARDAAGAQVSVSIFESGNQTTIVPEAKVTANGGSPPPSPAMAPGLPAAPNVGLIVKWNGSGWADETGNAKWTSSIPYTVADIDVAVIDAHSATPSISSLVRGVGTHIGNAVFDPVNNRLMVANDEARNLVRFEPNLRGHFLTTRLDSISLGSAGVTAFDLNSHINFNNTDGSDVERGLSLAMPGDLVRAADGTFFLAATSSAKVGVINSQGAVTSRIQVGQGPTGLALNESSKLLYVLNRFDESISTVDLGSQTQIATTAVGFNPEPDTVRNGRRFLYDTSVSAHGDVSCASCHDHGHRDGLAWDLGDPQGQMSVGLAHPMKGPMVTQSLRGIIGTEPLHWRGDRAALSNFNPAFQTLLGGPRQLTAAEMSAFTSFVQTLTYPPNPNENLDRTLPNPATGPNATRGKDLFNTTPFDKAAVNCQTCHNAFNFAPGTSRLIIPAVEIGTSQAFKAPQLRGMYQKLGMVNAPGEQLSGFGFVHDGSIDSLFNFLHTPVFTFQNDTQRQDIEQFMLAFDTGTAPAVGLMVTVNGSNKGDADVIARVNLLMAQANAHNCDLVVRGIFKGSARSFLFTGFLLGAGQFLTDRQSEPAVTSQALLQAADDGAELTFMGVPSGAGRRISIDHELNGILDGDQPKPNGIEVAQAFVWQHYLDFLNRQPDDAGFDFWTKEITSCGTNQICIDVKRINVSGAYFLSIEFQQTGYLIERMYKSAYGDAPNAVSTLGGTTHNVVVPIVRFSEFIPDVKQIGNGVVVNQGNWQKQLDDNKNAFSLAFVQRSRFTDPANYPTTMTPLAFVTRLANNAGVPANDADRTTALNEFGGAANTADVAARARALRDIAENATLFNSEQNRAFVLMQYFGYLRRDPNSGQDTDYTGFDFWLTKLNAFQGDYKSAEMVKAFINSDEYRRRFGTQ